MITKEFFKERILCAVNQARIRNLEIVHSWHLKIRLNKPYEFDNSGKVYILQMFIENRICHNLYYTNYDAAKILNIKPKLLQIFNYGFCRIKSTKLYDNIENWYYQFGIYVSEELERKKLCPNYEIFK